MSAEDVTVAEAREEMQSLQDHIARVCILFTERTGLDIDCIHISRLRDITTNVTKDYFIEIDVILRDHREIDYGLDG